MKTFVQNRIQLVMAILAKVMKKNSLHRKHHPTKKILTIPIAMVRNKPEQVAMVLDKDMEVRKVRTKRMTRATVTGSDTFKGGNNSDVKPVAGDRQYIVIAESTDDNKPDGTAIQQGRTENNSSVITGMGANGGPDGNVVVGDEAEPVISVDGEGLNNSQSTEDKPIQLPLATPVQLSVIGASSITPVSWWVMSSMTMVVCGVAAML